MNKIIPNIKSAMALPDYKLSILFEDGVSGIMDLKSWKGKGVFENWNDEKNFQAFKITGDNKIEWNENIDMNPDAFYLKFIDKSFDDYARNKQLLRNFD